MLTLMVVIMVSLGIDGCDFCEQGNQLCSGKDKEDRRIDDQYKSFGDGVHGP